MSVTFHHWKWLIDSWHSIKWGNNNFLERNCRVQPLLSFRNEQWRPSCLNKSYLRRVQLCRFQSEWPPSFSNKTINQSQWRTPTHKWCRFSHTQPFQRSSPSRWYHSSQFKWCLSSSFQSSTASSNSQLLSKIYPKTLNFHHKFRNN